jgi:hypothetical protein
MRRPLLHRLLAFYAILAITVFVFPGGMTSWLDDHNRPGWLDVPLSLMRKVDAASAAVGVKGVGERLRSRFRSAIGDDEG